MVKGNFFSLDGEKKKKKKKMKTGKRLKEKWDRPENLKKE